MNKFSMFYWQYTIARMNCGMVSFQKIPRESVSNSLWGISTPRISEVSYTPEIRHIGENEIFDKLWFRKIKTIKHMQSYFKNRISHGIHSIHYCDHIF